MPAQTQRKFRDDGVSAVIGTILMIAATVILGGAIYAAVNGFGDKDTTPKEDILFKAQAIDTGGDQVTDGIKLTYLSGPDLGEITLSVTRADGTAFNDYYTGKATGTSAPLTAWAPGEFVVVRADSSGVAANLASGVYLVTVSFNGNTVLDTSVTVG